MKLSAFALRNDEFFCVEINISWTETWEGKKKSHNLQLPILVLCNRDFWLSNRFRPKALNIWPKPANHQQIYRDRKNIVPHQSCILGSRLDVIVVNRKQVWIFPWRYPKLKRLKSSKSDIYMLILTEQGFLVRWLVLNRAENYDIHWLVLNRAGSSDINWLLWNGAGSSDIHWLALNRAGGSDIHWLVLNRLGGSDINWLVLNRVRVPIFAV